ncbi:MAG: thiol protease/hemagglutinin PrtT, partial [Bacteroidales bacterium]|nr:thiol protease/hemagglutinin PrtT [Bacteroidales bacterium]
VIVSGDDNAIPVLGYSFTGSFTSQNVPPNFRKWLEEYQDQIRYIRIKPELVPSEVKNEWTILSEGSSETSFKSSGAVPPLLTTTWSQSPFYNDLCPYDTETDSKSVSGCVATAMAQIMKYWNYPETGSGFHSYNHAVFGTLSANFGSIQYNWEEMPKNVTIENKAVATLIYHCGISVNMNYSGSSSGAYQIIGESPDENCSENAYKKYFGYDSALKGYFRDNFSTSEWIKKLKNNLDLEMPIEYGGIGAGGGHAFVCDGYDSNEFFHFNWGWGGYNDGYFAIDALNPSSTGTGGGSGGYNYSQVAIFGIKPPAQQKNYDLELYANIVISENPLFFGSTFTIQTDIANFGNNEFSGDFCVAIFDKDLNFIDYAEIIENATLGGGMHFTHGLSFSNTGSVNMVPGDYFAGVFYRPPGGEWKKVGNGSYNNYLEFEVYYVNDIELYSDLNINTEGYITQDQPFTITANILNDGKSTFTGDVEVSLYDLNGDFAATIETLTDASLEAGYYYENVEFSTGGVSIDPGTYLLALFHKPDGGDWTLSGSSYYSNQIKIIVKQAPYIADIYENNDLENEAYILDLNFQENTANVNTEGSNCHVGNDIDYYKILLEEGYNYSITAKVHDSYSGDNQQGYTNDVLWSFNAHGYWSEVYDDVMPGTIEVTNGEEVLFGVAPYFEGETGTYLLDILSRRTKVVSTELNEIINISVYPNPAKDVLNIEGTHPIRRLQIFDAKGSLMISTKEITDRVSLDISNLSEGIYFLHITQDNTKTIQKIIKQ